MTLKDFISDYDFEGSVVLLEGKREIPSADSCKLTQLGTLLAERTEHILFRSGNAKGADYLFSLGVSKVDLSRLQVITPYKGHRNKESLAKNIIDLDSIDIANEPEVVYQTRQSKTGDRLIDGYLAGNRGHVSMKAAYLLRDTVKVTGTGLIRGADFAIFWDDPGKPGSGGTGHTMAVCRRLGVPYIDQSVWYDWL